MKICSPQWDEETGVCLKHHVAMIPCLSCMAEHDPQVYATLSHSEIDYAMWDGCGIAGFFAEDWSWLQHRVEIER